MTPVETLAHDLRGIALRAAELPEELILIIEKMALPLGCLAVARHVEQLKFEAWNAGRDEALAAASAGIRLEEELAALKYDFRTQLAAAQKLADERGAEVKRLRAALRPFAEAGAEAIRQHGSKSYNFEQVLRDICSHFSLRMFKTAYFALKDSAT